MTPPCVVCGKPGGYRVKLQRHPEGRIFSGYPLCWRHVNALETGIRKCVEELKATTHLEARV